MQDNLIQTLVYVGISFLLGGAAIWWFLDERGLPHNPAPNGGNPPATVTTFEECAQLYPIIESYPPRCMAPDGRSFSQDIGNELDKRDLIRIDFPRPNAVIGSPLSIRGEARGNWFFEANFPVELRDANGNVLAQHYAQAEGEWMTTSFVSFKSTLTFTKPASGTKGTLILYKDNPSGLPENDDELSIPIRF